MTSWAVPSLATVARNWVKVPTTLATDASEPFALSVSKVPPSMTMTLTGALASCALYWLAIMAMVAGAVAAMT